MMAFRCLRQPLVQRIYVGGLHSRAYRQENCQEKSAKFLDHCFLELIVFMVSTSQVFEIRDNLSSCFK